MATTALKAVPILPKTIGGTIDQIKRHRDDAAALTKQAKAIKAAQTELEGHLFELMDAEGMDKASGKLATASLGEEEMTSIEDWDKYYAWIRKNNAFYLLERRPAQAANRELRAGRRGNKSLPGTSIFTKRKVNIRAR